MTKVLFSNRKFNKDSYELFDTKCKQEGIKVFHDVFSTDTIENTNQYGVDLILVDTTQTPIGYCEVEIRNMWGDKNFPYSCVSIPYRKNKLFIKNSLDNLFFIVFNKTFSRCLIARVSCILTKSEIITQTSKYGNTEQFFRLDLKYFLPLIKVNDTWVKTLNKSNAI